MVYGSQFGVRAHSYSRYVDECRFGVGDPVTSEKCNHLLSAATHYFLNYLNVRR